MKRNGISKINYSHFLLYSYLIIIVFIIILYIEALKNGMVLYCISFTTLLFVFIENNSTIQIEHIVTAFLNKKF